ncbi:PilC/PilY family type IV pilus protein, partial [Wohlfahrtiimonas larvae]
MKNRNVFYKILLLTFPVWGISSVNAETKAFKPSTEPVFSTPRAKPNIHMVLDDSGSMKTRDVPEYKNGPDILRTVALDRAVKALLNKYRDKAYLGVTFLYTANSNSGLTALKLDDYSKVTDQKFNSHLTNISNIIKNSPGNTPLYTAVYDTLKMFRGQPVSAAGNRTGTMQVETGRFFDKKYTNIYQYKQLESPIRYRCQQNHMIVMTDGEPNAESARGVAVVDKEIFRKTYPNSLGSLGNRYDIDGFDIINGVYLKDTVNLERLGPALGQIIADTNLKDWVTNTKDEAGKGWYQDDTGPMPLHVHSVSLHVDVDDKIYQNLTHATSSIKKNPGMNLGITKKNGGSAEDLLAAFDTIFATIIRSTSSASAVNDRTSSKLVKGKPEFDKDGNVDVKTIGTVRYDTVYDFRSYIGSVRARASYIDPQTGKSEKVNLWSTDTTITPEQGRYVTLSSEKFPGKSLLDLKKDKSTVLTEFKKIKSDFNDSGLEWLTNFKMNKNMGDLRERLYPLGSITSPDVVLANKDMININIADESMSYDLKTQLEQWWVYKAKFQPNNFIIVGDNDGMISFIKAQRGLSKNSKAGERDTAYFPKMLVHRFDEIAKANRNSTLVIEGRTNLVDARVYQATGDTGGEHLYATLGLTAMGGGGKGIAGYRVYAEKAEVVKNWSKNKKTISKPSSNDIYEKVTPLFEITNEGPSRTPGFENLGYTYSGFEFFNRIIDRGTTFGGESNPKGQAVAVFGNGFGAEPNASGNRPSSLYFIDAYTGEKLHEIILNPNGLGAATPSLLVSKDGIVGGQKVDKIYVGDYSGTLYRVEFNSKDFKDPNTKITALFKAPKTNFGQSAISVKPLVVRARNSSLYRVFFGTGIAASHELDRYDNSKVQHNVYGLTDYGKKGGSETFALGQATHSLQPVLTINHLKKGNVRYKTGQQPSLEDYESVGEYDLETTTPFADPNEGHVDKDGWYIALTADGNQSGERVIKDPQYDEHSDAVIFFTWGIQERFS